MEDHSQSPALFDEEILLWRMGGNPDDAKAVLEAFVAESRTLFAMIRVDIKGANAFSLRSHAESLHEGAAMVSSMILKHYARRLMLSAKRNDFEQALKILPRLDENFNMLVERLRESKWLE